VKFGSTPNLKVPVENDTTVSQLKQKLNELTNVPVDKIKLIFKGKILKVGDDKMNDLKIAADCTVHMIQNMAQGDSPSNPNPAQNNPVTNNTSAQPQGNTTSNQNQGDGAFPSFPNMGGMGGMPGMGGMGGMPGMGGMGGMPGMGGMDMASMQSMMSNPQFQAMARQMLSNPDTVRQMIANNPQLQQMSQNMPGLEQMLSNPDLINNAFNQMSGMGGGQGGMPGMGGNANPLGGTPSQTTPSAPVGGFGSNNVTQPSNTQPSNTQPSNTQPQQNPMGQQPMPNFGGMMNNPLFQQYMGMGGGMNQQQPNVNYEEQYKDQLQQLSDMGFTNKQVNIDVLKQCYGNVEAAIERLLTMMN